jgi:hypothetical protein
MFNLFEINTIPCTMKELKSIVIFLWAFLSVFASQSASRFLIDSTSMWKVDHIRNGVSDENKHEPGDYICKYFIHNDTLIGSHTYYQLFKTGTSYFDVPFYFENVYMGALRCENNKFYFVEKDQAGEVLLYNFNAEIGDKIQVPYNGSFEQKVVSSIDTLPDGRKLIHFNPKEPIMGCGDQYIIEGIGGSGGLLEGPACNHFWTFDNHLVCYTKNGMLEYHDQYFQFNCDIIDGPSTENYIDSSCVWRVDKQVNTDSISDFEKLDYFICGDTVIGTEEYMKLCKTGFQLYIDGNGKFTSGFNTSVYIGAIREVGKKIYFTEKGSDDEKLLYNFNLNVGDVIDGQISYGDTLLSVDSILDNRKAFYMSNNYWEKFIMEGIGSDKGLLENKNESSTLVCFMKNGASVYHNSSGTECNLSYNEYNFYECDKLKTIPENPDENDAVKVVARICYTVSADNPVYPTLASQKEILEDNSINIKLNYNYDDQNNSALQKIVIPVFDTIDIGRLHAGDFLIDLNVNTTHSNSGDPYTVEYDKNLYLSFSVSQSNGTNDPLVHSGFKIYPSPAKDFLMVECNDDNIRINTIELYTISGTKVKTIPVEEQNRNKRMKIDVSNLKKGIYLITFNTGDSNFVQKFIID